MPRTIRLLKDKYPDLVRCVNLSLLNITGDDNLGNECSSFLLLDYIH